MNERIKELAAKSNFGHMENEEVVYDHRLEKFAELIISECIEVCENLVSNINSSTERWKVKGDFEIIHIGMAGGAEHCVTYIKEHFGIK